MFIITDIFILPSVCILNLLWFEMQGASVSLTLTQFVIVFWHEFFGNVTY